MRKLSALGTALLISGGLVAGAAPAQAQPDPGTISCGTLIAPICSAAGRQIQHALEEVGHAYDAAYTYYEYADRTVRCVVFKECP
ncbi:MAG TPA: hypothetical protein VEU29_02110 [Actinomycetota bacterium]|nr:hypothetical protein [Actinomycetota bacterium]